MQQSLARATAVLLVLIGAGLLTAGAVSATEELRDAARSPERLRERPVADGLTLAIRVTLDGVAVEDAHITIVAIRGEERSRVARGDTDADGRVLLELPRGAYEVHVRSDAGDVVKTIRLHESMRLPIALAQRQR